jgi:hypothetical protein
LPNPKEFRRKQHGLQGGCAGIAGGFAAAVQEYIDGEYLYIRVKKDRGEAGGYNANPSADSGAKLGNTTETSRGLVPSSTCGSILFITEDGV